MKELADWKPRPRPARVALDGRYCRLEPLDPLRHSDALFAASMAPGAEARFRYLFNAPQSRDGFNDWMAHAVRADDPLIFAVVASCSSRAVGSRTSIAGKV